MKTVIIRPAAEAVVARVPTTLTTPRLALRPFTGEDLEAAFGWFGDPEVMRFTPTGADASIEETRKRVDGYRAHQETHGFSKWVITERASGEVVGDAGLLVLPGSGIDLGYRLLPRHWNKGFATEAGARWVEAAFKDFGLERLTAFVHPMNGPSLRVIRKLGLRSTGLDRVLGMEAETFVLDAQDFLGRRSGQGPP